MYKFVKEYFLIDIDHADADFMIDYNNICNIQTI